MSDSINNIIYAEDRYRGLNKSSDALSLGGANVWVNSPYIEIGSLKYA